MRVRATISALFGIMLAAGPAVSQGLLASDPDAIMTAMQEEGFLVKRQVADDGTPKLVSRVADTEFQVYFYGCESGDPCTSIQISAGYDLGTSMSASKINQWNSENRYIRAYIDDEGDPFIKLDMVMIGDGVGKQSFAETLELWRVLVESFEDYIDW